MVTNNHYRWDFVGLSTDTKPTPDTSDKVVDGSTFYCSDTSKLYVFCKNNWYERKPLGSGGGGTSYTAGDGITIADDTISVDTTTIQEKLTAGANIQISAENEISATDTTYSAFTGTDGQTAGVAGLVPAPATTDADKFLKSDGTWGTAGGGSVTPVQTTGTSTTDVMSQNATTSMVFADPGTNKKVRIGNTNNNGTNSIGIGSGLAGGNSSIVIGSGTASNSYSIALGSASVYSDNSIAIGRSALVPTGSTYQYSVALGAYSSVTRAGEVNIGSGGDNHGYNNTNYRVLGGVHDGQLAQDAVTVNQVNSVIDAINTALSTNISHIGA